MSLLNRVQQLPKGFVWGAATAAYQTEGSTKVAGKGKTMWDDYLVAQGRFLPDPASDFYNRYEEDIRLSAEHGLNAIRVSIAWTRIFPNGDDAEPLAEGVKHYHELFACCKKYGVEPMCPCITLTPPPPCSTRRLLNRKTVDAMCAMPSSASASSARSRLVHHQRAHQPLALPIHPRQLPAQPSL